MEPYHHVYPTAFSYELYSQSSFSQYELLQHSLNLHILLNSIPWWACVGTEFLKVMQRTLSIKTYLPLLSYRSIQSTPTVVSILCYKLFPSILWCALIIWPHIEFYKWLSSNCSSYHLLHTTVLKFNVHQLFSTDILVLISHTPTKNDKSVLLT